MKITALESMDFSVKGHDTVPLRTGEEIDVPDEIAERIIGHGFAEEALEGAEVDETDESEVDDQDNTDTDDGDSGDGDSDDGTGDDPDGEEESDDSGWPDGLMPAAEEALEGAEVAPGDIAGMSDQELLDITNVGPATVKLLREVFGPPAELP